MGTPAGTVIVQGSLVGITKVDIGAGRLDAVHIVGVYDVEKSNVTIPLGSKVYWDATAKKAVVAARMGEHFEHRCICRGEHHHSKRRPMRFGAPYNVNFKR